MILFSRWTHFFYRCYFLSRLGELIKSIDVLFNLSSFFLSGVRVFLVNSIFYCENNIILIAVFSIPIGKTPIYLNGSCFFYSHLVDWSLVGSDRIMSAWTRMMGDWRDHVNVENKRNMLFSFPSNNLQ